MATDTLINVTLNGEKKKLGAGLSLQALLDSLSIQKEKVVIEHNLEIIPKDEFQNKIIRENDQIEIVHFVGGGAGAKTSGALVIVESPAKCKTINKFLGSGYEVAASMGHVIDLPKSKMGIDIENNFEPKYIVTKDRKKTLSELKKKAKSKKEIYLACDPDREGEAISWHLKNELGAGKKIARVVFNEITKEAVQEAFKHPMDIDMNLVGAQQARRVVDRLVGYSLSPLLWQKVGRGLSAGRVQSVALRLIVDREREIRAFVPEEYWSVEAHLRKKKSKDEPFLAKLEKVKDKKLEIKDTKLAHDTVEKIKKSPFVVREIKSQKRKRNPYPPFTTSKLQQAAYNLFRFQASKTMRLAQMLYEGVDIGEEGSVGLITYMRTDAVRISEQALAEVRQFIKTEYGKDYLPEKPHYYKAKKQAQEAHEAIRPTSVKRRPKDMEPYLTPELMKLYTLIWNQTVASQMTSAVIHQESVDIAAGDYGFKATGSRIEFPGFLVLQGKEEEEESNLPPLKEGEELDLDKLEPLQHFTKPPARYTDATIVKALEERGIGRPSTYAPTIATITSRDYVRRESGSLLPTELGMLVTDLLVKHFGKLLDFEFTAKMEEELDEVEEGKVEWVGVVRNFYGQFNQEMDQARSEMQTVRREAEATNEICEKCGKPMVIKWGRRGRFMSCSGWPECKNAKSISTDVACPQCQQGKLVQRRAKSGKGRSFFGCTRYPECTFITNRLPKKDEPALANKDASEFDDNTGSLSTDDKNEP